MYTKDDIPEEHDVDIPGDYALSGSRLALCDSQK